MTRRTHRSVAALATVLCIVLLAPSCGNGSSVDTGSGDDADATSATTTTDLPLPEPTADIMAAAAYQLVTVDQTFGSGPSPFSTYLIQDHTDPTAGSGNGPSSGNPRPLTGRERSAIEVMPR